MIALENKTALPHTKYNDAGADPTLGIHPLHMLDCFGSDDYEEGRKAFMEKRKPTFKRFLISRLLVDKIRLLPEQT